MSLVDSSDLELRNAVQTALTDALGLESALIGVAVDQRTVLLTGEVSSEQRRRTAHDVVRGVRGVRAISDDLSCRGSRAAGTTDAEIAVSARRALHHEPRIPRQAVVAEVRNRVLILTGSVQTVSQRMAAERAMLALPGLTKIENRIAIAEPEAAHHAGINHP